MGFMSIPCDQLDANPLIAEYFRRHYDVSKIGVLATDAGGVKIGTVYAERLNVPLAVCDKRRWADNEDPEIRAVIGIEEIQGREVAIFDDEILTGGTMTRAITALKDRFGLRRLLRLLRAPGFQRRCHRPHTGRRRQARGDHGHAAPAASDDRACTWSAWPAAGRGHHATSTPPNRSPRYSASRTRCSVWTGTGLEAP